MFRHFILNQIQNHIILKKFCFYIIVVRLNFHKSFELSVNKQLYMLILKYWVF
jgi:hypothetical protein